MADQFEHDHPRANAGRFTEKQRLDPGSSAITSHLDVLRRHRINPDNIPAGRNQVWEYADARCADTGAQLDTIGREELWAAIVSHANPAWVVGLTERHRLLRQDEQ